LNHSDWVNGDEERLITLIINGLQGEITVNGQSFQGVMPAFNYLEDEQIAQILTYIRQTFGNDSPSVQGVEVQHQRRRLKRQEAEDI
jgi:mono/diheme cytochrome c family protein